MRGPATPGVWIGHPVVSIDGDHLGARNVLLDRSLYGVLIRHVEPRGWGGEGNHQCRAVDLILGREPEQVVAGTDEDGVHRGALDEDPGLADPVWVPFARGARLRRG